MKARNGKIARLSSHVREELNVRLERSQPGPSLLAWLNALPEVQGMLRRDFGGEPISEQNLSQWRRGGFQDWLTRRDFFDEVRNADGPTPERKPLSADRAAGVLATRYARLLERWNGECTRDFEARARVLNGLSRGITELQREAHRPTRDEFDETNNFDSDHPNQAPSHQVTANHSEKTSGQV
ncbi:MAG: hypothetical protein ABSA83_06930 [Verrucomicrobiota bacterium]|jgi:hypothetical protein